MTHSKMLAVLGFLALPVTAMAGNLADPVAPPMVPVTPPMAAMDWSGAYVGLSYGQASGEYEADVDGTITLYDLDDSDAYGVFGGYNFQRGNLVYGGEISYMTVDDMVLLTAGNDDTIDSILDVRGRIGYVVGNAMIYGAIGFSSVENTINVTTDNTLSGTNLGIGVDYMFSENFVVGLDYTQRFVEGENNSTTNPFDIETDVDTLSLRVSYLF